MNNDDRSPTARGPGITLHGQLTSPGSTCSSKTLTEGGPIGPAFHQGYISSAHYRVATEYNFESKVLQSKMGSDK